MRIPKATIEAIRERTDIGEVISRHVTLKRRGANLLGLCPFHQEKTPSFNVLPSKQIYHCFGCGVGGDVFRFLMELEGLSFVEAIKALAGPAGVTVEERELSPGELERLRQKTTLYEVCEEAAGWFHNNLLTRPEAEPARAYLRERGIGSELIASARLGFAPDAWDALLTHLHRQRVPQELSVRAGLAKKRDNSSGAYDVFRNRVIFPIMDSRDRPVAFGGRLLSGDGPKYLNSPESDVYEKSSTLYGLSWARSGIQKTGRAIVVEGYFDVLSLVQAGFTETVATCGTALTEAHVRQLRRFTTTAIALFDADEAGMRAADRSLPLFLDAGIEARHLDIPGAKDPDEFIQSAGPEAFEKQLSRATPLLELIVKRSAARHGTTPGGRADAVKEVLPLLRRLPTILRSDMLIRAANLLDVREGALREALGRPRREARQPDAGAAWRGNRELNHLLWLLLHHPTRVGPHLAATDPAHLTDRVDVRQVLGRLMAGDSLASVVEDQDDPDLVRVLQAAAARQELYTADEAEGAVQHILGELELRAVEAETAAVRRRLDALDPDDDKEAWMTVMRERSALQTRLATLRRTRKRGRRPIPPAGPADTEKSGG